MNVDECFRWPRLDRRTQARIAAYLMNGDLSYDQDLFETFEGALSRYFGAPYALLTNNGTAAAISAFFALGLQRGDELIAPPYTHWATVIPATLFGLRIVFGDVERDSLNLDVDAVAMRISRKTRAVVVCHLYGNPAEARGLRALCDRHGLALIEDLSHAPGATLDGKPVGAFGDLAFISFQGRKAISGGEGGALLCRSPNHYQRAMELGQPKRLFRLPPACRTYDRVSRGYKFRISALHAFIAYLSFQRLPRTNATRAAMCGSLRERLAKIPYVRLTQVPAGGERVYFRNELFVTGGETERERVVKALRASALPARGPDYEYLPSLRPFRRHFRPVGCLPNAERNLAALIVLPPFTAYRRRIVDVYAKVMQSLV